MKKWLLVLFFSPLLLSGEEPGQVSITVTPRQARIGDHIEIRAVIRAGNEVDEVEFKLGGDRQWLDVLYTKDSPPRTFQNQQVFEKGMTVAVFQTGSFSVGPFQVIFKQAGKILSSSEVKAETVTIQSVLQGGKNEDISDLKPLQDIKGDPFYLLKYMLILLALVLIIILFFVFLKRRRAAAAAPPLTVEEELQARIRELLARELHKQGEYKLFFILLTETIKAFLQRYYSFPAEDFTSSETLLALSRREEEDSIRGGLGRLFTVADEVKFARMRPGDQAMQKILEFLPFLVGEYRRRRQAAEEELNAGSGK